MKLFTTCVNYEDLLSVTLPAWTRYGNVVVIARPNDTRTGAVCATYGARIAMTEAWFKDSPVGINKGAAMQAVIELEASYGDTIAVFDADCYPRGHLPLNGNPDVLIGCRRFECKDATVFNQTRHAHYSSLTPISDGTYRPNLVRGYFQTFIYREGLTFGRTRDKTFSGCDLWVAAQFPVNQWCDPDTFYVLHLGKPGVNWRGRVTEPWPQL